MAGVFYGIGGCHVTEIRALRRSSAFVVALHVRLIVAEVFIGIGRAIGLEVCAFGSTIQDVVRRLRNMGLVSVIVTSLKERKSRDSRSAEDLSRFVRLEGQFAGNILNP